LDEINLASPSLLNILESWILEAIEPGKYMLSNGEIVNHAPIAVVATMNSAALSKARSALSTKLQGASHFFRLLPFTQNEMHVLSSDILEKAGFSLDDVDKVLESHRAAAEAVAKESGITAEKDAVTLREILRMADLRRVYPSLSLAHLTELTYAAQLTPSTAISFFDMMKTTSFAKDCVPSIRERSLYLTDIVKIPLRIENENPKPQLPLTAAQLRVACFVGAGIMANRSVGLFGETGSGKTHIIRTLARAVGARLRIIQFNSETGMYMIFFNFVIFFF
jgi:midasin (ATPase involved in ribosome maturation)